MEFIKQLYDFINVKTVLLGLVLIIFGCGKVDYKPKYRDFTNDRERENLIGKVKKLEQYKANVIDLKTGETDKPIIEFKKEFTEIGNILKQEHFDSFGMLEQYVENIYDENGYRIESVLKNYLMPMTSIEKVVFDTIIKQPIFIHSVFNDTLMSDAFFRYDKHGNVVELINVKNGDTTLINVEYVYDNNGRILLKKTQSDDGEDAYINEFKYDSNGNLISMINTSDFYLEIKSMYEYDKTNRITKMTEYEGNQMTREILYDKFYNKTLVRFYANNILDKELKYSYKFDRYENWIQQKVFLKQCPKNKTFVPIFTETRKIEYYK